MNCTFHIRRIAHGAAWLFLLLVASICLLGGLSASCAYADDECEIDLSIMAPEGVVFDDPEDALIVISQGSGTAKRVVYEGTGEQQQAHLTPGNYSYVVKAALCDTQTGSFEVSASGQHVFSLDEQGPWSGAFVGQGAGVAWSGNYDTLWYDNHTDEAVLYLRTAEDLAGMARLIDPARYDGGSQAVPVTFEGKTLVLLGDINLGGSLWSAPGDPMYNGSLYFSGVFDGHGSSIHNLNATMKHQGNALFAGVKNAVIKDLSVDGVSGVAQYAYVAGIAAIAKSSIFERCCVDVDISTTASYAGGICGTSYNESQFIECISKGSMTCRGVNVSSFGGIVGNLGAPSVVQSCVNEMSFDLSLNAGGSSSYCARAGGIAGNAGVGNISFIDCRNEGLIAVSESGVGGIVGYLAGGSNDQLLLSGCSNSAAVEISKATGTTRAVGGLVGVFAGVGSDNKLIECSNSGPVAFSGSNEDVAAAGLIGAVASDSLKLLALSGCYNNASVENAGMGEASIAAGLIGVSVSPSLVASGCYSVGGFDVSHGAQKAGLFGSCAEGSEFTGCFYGEGSAEEGLLGAADEAGRIEAKEPEAMKTTDFLGILNEYANVFSPDQEGRNGGYPVLSKQAVRAITNSSVAHSDSAAYTGAALPPSLVVKSTQGDELVLGQDYTITCYTNDSEKTVVELDALKEIGSYLVVVDGAGSCVGRVSFTYRITQRILTEDMFAPIGEKPFTGTAYEASQLIRIADGLAFTDGDYTISTSGSDLASVGSHTITVTGTNHCEGTVRLSFTIGKGPLSVDEIASLPYTGKAVRPTIVVRNASGVVLALGSDYKVSFQTSNGEDIADPGITECGAYTAVISAKDGSNYEGSVDAAINVMPSSFTVDEISEVRYTGKAVSPNVVVRNAIDASCVASANQYRVTYETEEGASIGEADLKETGVYVAIVSGTGDPYRRDCSVRASFRIMETDANVAAVPAITYTGAALLPEIKVSDYFDEDSLFSLGKDYLIRYYRDNMPILSSDIVDAGTYRVTIDMLAPHKGSFERTFIVLPGHISCNSFVEPTYTGAVVSPSFEVIGPLGTRLAKGTGYTLTYKQGDITLTEEQLISAGSYTACITGVNNYAGRIDIPFEVKKASLALESLSGGVYTGLTIEPTMEVLAGGVSLASTQYTYRITQNGHGLDYHGMIDVGAYDVEIAVLPSIADNFIAGAASAKGTCMVTPATMSVKPMAPSTYSGTAQAPTVIVESGEEEIPASLYTIAWSDASGNPCEKNALRNAGTYAVTVRANNPLNFVEDAITATYTILPVTPVLSSVPDLVYNGKAQTPKITVGYGAATLDSSQYSVEYRRSSGEIVSSDALISAGSYRVIVTLNDDSNFSLKTLDDAFSIVVSESQQIAPEMQNPITSGLSANGSSGGTGTGQSALLAQRTTTASASAEGGPMAAATAEAQAKDARITPKEAAGGASNPLGDMKNADNFNNDESSLQENPAADVLADAVAVTKSHAGLFGAAACFIACAVVTGLHKRRQARELIQQLSALGSSYFSQG